MAIAPPQYFFWGGDLFVFKILKKDFDPILVTFHPSTSYGGQGDDAPPLAQVKSVHSTNQEAAAQTGP